MLNEVVIEGTIAGDTWTYSGDTLFRLACDRDLQRGPKGTDPRDGSDYITVRLPATRFAGVPLALDRSKLIRVHGFLQSREYQENLATFLKRANGLTSQVQAADDVRRQVTHNRVTTEVIAERLQQIDRPAPTVRRAPAARRLSPNGGPAAAMETAPVLEPAAAE